MATSAAAASLEDVPSVDLMTELLRRMKCSSKPDKRLILIGIFHSYVLKKTHYKQFFNYVFVFLLSQISSWCWNLFRSENIMCLWRQSLTLLGFLLRFLGANGRNILLRCLFLEILWVLIYAFTSFVHRENVGNKAVENIWISWFDKWIKQPVNELYKVKRKQLRLGETAVFGSGLCSTGFCLYCIFLQLDFAFLFFFMVHNFSCCWNFTVDRLSLVYHMLPFYLQLWSFVLKEKIGKRLSNFVQHTWQSTNSGAGGE